MNPTNALIYEKTFRRFLLGILCLISIPFVVGGFMYPLPHPFDYFFLTMGVLNAVSITVVYFIPAVYIKKLVIPYFFIFMLLAYYPMTVFYLVKGVSVPLFWYIVIPVIIYTVHGERSARWWIWCLSLLLSTFALAFVFRHIVYRDELVFKNPAPFIIFLRSDMINATFAFLSICYSLYYMDCFRRIRTDCASETEEPLSADSSEQEKYGKIYEQIESYFETKQPYLNPDLKIAQMAYELNINSVYLTKAIRFRKNTNFNNFINFYRVERAKKLMQTNLHKYTIEHIYLSSGFNSQSSFNRAFKIQEGVTPSEYCKKCAEVTK
ncbi:MAG: AraC family transcriptional regulator [Tannerellaceae bacterium]|jgi:AraC-like DNA-binding protein|nr:AraC family transcriptional regulator [Tannerellaceae bacterium]